MPAKHPQAAGQRALVFIDGQNLFYAAKEAFGYNYPNYDAIALASRICRDQGWVPAEIHFYTGVPDVMDHPFWNHFWNAKLAQMGRMNVVVYSRPLKYRNVTVKLPDGRAGTRLIGHEKGIDVRIALDIVRAADERRGEIILILSQDQDLTEAVEEAKLIGRRHKISLRIASAFPLSATSRNRLGIDKTDWIPIDRTVYDACLDPRDYRPKKR